MSFSHLELIVILERTLTRFLREEDLLASKQVRYYTTWAKFSARKWRRRLSRKFSLPPLPETLRCVTDPLKGFAFLFVHVQTRTERMEFIILPTPRTHAQVRNRMTESIWEAAAKTRYATDRGNTYKSFTLFSGFFFRLPKHCTRARCSTAVE